MHAPVITRHRRPFLAPIWISAAVVLGVCALALGAYRSAVLTTVILVSYPDSPAAGQAQQLARMFGERDRESGVEAIYASATPRARELAAPLAERLGVTPVEVPAREVRSLAARARREHRGRAVLVIGGAGELPELVRALSGHRIVPLPPSGQDDALYVVSVPTFGPAGVLRMTY
ncbi:MAG: hypothetical protein IPI06_03120 [Gammaproteobacteria bacterium]|nr:hypothetical protein [Gammaproteobacteria bacterium]